MSHYSYKGSPSGPSTSYFVCELVDVLMTSTADTRSVFFEMRWGSFTVKSSTKKAVKGIALFTERIKIAVPTLAQRRLPVELHLFTVNETTAQIVAPLAWMPVPSQDILSGKKLRSTFKLRAAAEENQPTVLQLNAAFFVEDTLSSTGMRPNDIPYTDPVFHSSAAGLSPNAAGAGSVSSPTTGNMSFANNMSLVNNNMSLTSVNSDQAASLVAQFAATGDKKQSAAAEQQQQAVLLRLLQQNPHLLQRLGIGAAGGTAVQTTTSSTQTDLTGPVVSESLLAGTRVPQVPKKMEDEATAEQIRRGFDFPVWSSSREEVFDPAGGGTSGKTTIAGGAPLKNPVDLLTMKRSVAAWPRDEVEGLIVYGEQMKRYSEQLERANARLVIGAMKTATTELRDMPDSVEAAMAASGLSRSASKMLRSVSPSAQRRAGSAGPSRSGSSFPQPPFAGGNPNQQQQRTSSVLSQQSAAAGDDSHLSPGLSRIVRSASRYDEPEEDVNTFEEIGKPQFLTRLEMSRGEPLNDAERSHVMRNFSDL